MVWEKLLIDQIFQLQKYCPLSIDFHQRYCALLVLCVDRTISHYTEPNYISPPTFTFTIDLWAARMGTMEWLCQETIDTSHYHDEVFDSDRIINVHQTSGKSKDLYRYGMEWTDLCFSVCYTQYNVFQFVAEVRSFVAHSLIISWVSLFYHNIHYIITPFFHETISIDIGRLANTIQKSIIQLAKIIIEIIFFK